MHISINVWITTFEQNIMNDVTSWTDTFELGILVYI